MRYLRAGKTIRSIANVLHRKRFHLDEMSDYMRRDIGLIDGGPIAGGGGLAEADARLRHLDLLTLTPRAS